MRILLAICLSLGLAACAVSEDDSKPASSEVSVDQENKVDDISVGDRIGVVQRLFVQVLPDDPQKDQALKGRDGTLVEFVFSGHVLLVKEVEEERCLVEVVGIFTKRKNQLEPGRLFYVETERLRRQLRLLNSYLERMDMDREVFEEKTREESKAE